MSPSGLPTGDGSLANPWDLQTALNQPSGVIAGSIISLSAGTYHGNYTSELTGTAANPIVLKNITGERVILDGSLAGETIKNVPVLLINGAYTWFVGFEITNSDPERIITESGSNPPERRGAGVAVFGAGIKLINLIIHDVGEGIDAWTPAENSEYYGNLIFNNGWYAPDREHGHGIYTQNNTGTKKYIDNISFNNFGYGWQVYGSINASLKNFYLEGNLVFNNRWLIGGGAPLENIELNNNFTYRDTIQIGYASNVLNNGLILRRNYFASLLKIYYWNNVLVKSNTLFAGPTYNYPFLIDLQGPPDLSSFDFDSNTYHWAVPPPASQTEIGFGWENNALPETDPNQKGLIYFSQWQTSGKDINGTVEYFPRIDDTYYNLNVKKIFVRKNIYDTAKANIMVYNWDNSNTVDVDVTGILKAGDNYELHSVLNYFGDVVTGTYTAGLLSIPMTGHTVAWPLGYTMALGPNTFPTFGSFVLINTSAGVALPVNFLNFEVSLQDKTALLQWSTSDEHNLSEYSVERSANGVDFHTIGTVHPVTNPLPVNDYKFIDLSPLNGTSYYRIKELDLTNQFSYSDVRKLLIVEKGFGCTVVQNPAVDFLKLRLELEKPAKVKFEISDATGRLLLSEYESFDEGNSSHNISIAKWPKGKYYITVKAVGRSETKSFVKQ